MEKEFQEIVLLSEQMLVKAKKSEWDQLTELERKRDLLMGNFFSKPLAEVAKKQLEDGVRLILDADREVMALCALKQQALRASLTKMGKNRNAAQAYAATV